MSMSTKQAEVLERCEDCGAMETIGSLHYNARLCLMCYCRRWAAEGKPRVRPHYANRI